MSSLVFSEDILGHTLFKYDIRRRFREAKMEQREKKIDGSIEKMMKIRHQFDGAVVGHSHSVAGVVGRAYKVMFNHLKLRHFLKTKGIFAQSFELTNLKKENQVKGHLQFYPGNLGLFKDGPYYTDLKNTFSQLNVHYIDSDYKFIESELWEQNRSISIKLKAQALPEFVQNELRVLLAEDSTKMSDIKRDIYSQVFGLNLPSKILNRIGITEEEYMKNHELKNVFMKDVMTGKIEVFESDQFYK